MSDAPRMFDEWWGEFGLSPFSEDETARLKRMAERAWHAARRPAELNQKQCARCPETQDAPIHYPRSHKWRHNFVPESVPAPHVDCTALFPCRWQGCPYANDEQCCDNICGSCWRRCVRNLYHGYYDDDGCKTVHKVSCPRNGGWRRTRRSQSEICSCGEHRSRHCFVDRGSAWGHAADVNGTCALIHGHVFVPVVVEAT